MDKETTIKRLQGLLDRSNEEPGVIAPGIKSELYDIVASLRRSIKNKVNEPRVDIDNEIEGLKEALADAQVEIEKLKENQDEIIDKHNNLAEEFNHLVKQLKKIFNT